MKYHELETSARKDAKRAGRGIAAGRGKTAGRGTKGQNSRSGSGRKPGFEGGQNPLMQRIPKLRGFNARPKDKQHVKVSALNQLSGKTVDNYTLFQAGLVESPYHEVKLIYDTNPSKPLSVSLQGASKNAIQAIQKAGGSYKKTAKIKRMPKEQSDTSK
jgi:large subunit ribosomal protein L15